MVNEYAFWREFTASLQVVLDFFLLLCFYVYMHRIYQEDETSIKRWLRWGPPTRFSAALAIWIFHLGDIINRGYYFVFRHEYDLHKTNDWVPIWTLFFGSFLLIVGMMYKIQVFSRPLGIWLWVWTALLSLMIAYALTQIPF